MKLLALLLGYLGATAGLFGTIVAAVLWLVRPDPNAKHQPHVAPIAPRIAESIARKMEPLPAVADVGAREPEPAKPVMHEMPVSLTPPRDVRIRELPAHPPLKHKVPRSEHRVAAQEAAPAMPSAPAPVSTGRSDFPY